MTTSIRELDSVVLLFDRPDLGLAAGDVGAVVHAPAESEVVEVEFVNWSGQTVALVTLPLTELRQLNEAERIQSRSVATTDR